MIRFPRAACSLVPGLTLAAALSLGGLPAHAVGHTITTVGTSFSPSSLTITAGDTVTWTNGSGGSHNVHAEDGSFRCANGCDGSGSGNPSTANWSFTRTFATAGTVRFYCDNHGAPGGIGMSGTITVQAAGGGEQKGSLRFSTVTNSVSEAAGNATISVQRVGGDDGAASVHFATFNGTATAGSDYTARAGDLTWADSDDTTKTFTVPILNDTANEPNETINLMLTAATGAALGNPASALLTIIDNDAPSTGGNAPAAPTNLTATAQSTTSIVLIWVDHANDESEFRIERKKLGATTFQQVGTAQAGTTSFQAEGLDPATAYVFRVRAANANGASAYTNEAQEATLAAAGPCVEGPNTLCLNNDRFKVEVAFRSAAQSGMGTTVPLPSAPDSGLFYFFNPGNIELLVKVLNACVPALGNRYWVFYAATTDTEIFLTVTDTQTQKVKVYFNPLGTAALPIQDTNAFATCP